MVKYNYVYIPYTEKNINICCVYKLLQLENVRCLHSIGERRVCCKSIKKILDVEFLKDFTPVQDSGCYQRVEEFNLYIIG